MESMECVDIVVLCIIAGGEDAANLAAHVSRDWLRATRQLWPHGWTSGAEAAASSLDRFRWAQSLGCPWSGRALLRAAARAGALDLLKVVAVQYKEWDYGATTEASEADNVHVIEWLERRGLLGPWYGELRAAGPRVREIAKKWRMLNGSAVKHADPARHPARLADGAVHVDGVVYGSEAALQAAKAVAASTGRPAQVEVEQLAPDGLLVISGWRLISNLRALPGTSIVRVESANARRWNATNILREAIDPRRVWLTDQWLHIAVAPDPRSVFNGTDGAHLGCTFIGTWTNAPVDEKYDDGRFCYYSGVPWRACDVSQLPLERADGRDDVADPIFY